MSTDLQDAIEAVVGAYMAENGGGIVTSWHFIADAIDSDGDHSWLHSTSPDQKVTTTMGLLAWAQGVARFEQQCHLEDISED